MTSIKLDKVSSNALTAALTRNNIAIQNDAFRKMPLQDESVGRWVVTQAVNEKGNDFVARCIAEVRSFDAFTEEMDPHGEHGMGAFEVDGENVWFKIDLYDANYEGGSPDPTEITVTRRVLTILFPSDY